MRPPVNVRAGVERRLIRHCERVHELLALDCIHDALAEFDAAQRLRRVLEAWPKFETVTTKGADMKLDPTVEKRMSIRSDSELETAVLKAWRRFCSEHGVIYQQPTIEITRKWGKGCIELFNVRGRLAVYHFKEGGPLVRDFPPFHEREDNGKPLIGVHAVGDPAEADFKVC